MLQLHVLHPRTQGLELETGFFILRRNNRSTQFGVALELIVGLLAKGFEIPSCESPFEVGLNVDRFLTHFTAQIDILEMVDRCGHAIDVFQVLLGFLNVDFGQNILLAERNAIDAGIFADDRGERGGVGVEFGCVKFDLLPAVHKVVHRRVEIFINLAKFLFICGGNLKPGLDAIGDPGVF